MIHTMKMLQERKELHTGEFNATINIILKGIPMWKKPIIKEIQVGLEINCYMCAEL